MKLLHSLSSLLACITAPEQVFLSRERVSAYLGTYEEAKLESSLLFSSILGQCQHESAYWALELSLKACSYFY